MPCAADLDNAAACAMAEDWIRADGLTERARNTWEQSLRLTAAMHHQSPLEEIDALFRASYRSLRTPAAFERIEGAEHMVMIDQPRRFQAAVV